jgi:hypothetical protein
MQHVHAASSCNLFMQHEYAAWRRGHGMKHEKEHELDHKVNLKINIKMKMNVKE